MLNLPCARRFGRQPIAGSSLICHGVPTSTIEIPFRETSHPVAAAEKYTGPSGPVLPLLGVGFLSALAVGYQHDHSVEYLTLACLNF